MLSGPSPCFEEEKNIEVVSSLLGKRDTVLDNTDTLRFVSLGLFKLIRDFFVVTVFKKKDHSLIMQEAIKLAQFWGQSRQLEVRLSEKERGNIGCSSFRLFGDEGTQGVMRKQKLQH